MDLGQGEGVGIEALVVIGGSTASGKSALALGLAEALGGLVVNADSQQLYRDLPILSARPTAEDEARAPHRLYGVLGPDEQASVARWLELIAPLLRSDRTLVVTGGTGLYLEALLHGIAPVPEIPDGLRAALRAEAAGVPTAALHARLALRDRVMAARLQPTDRQRVLRALEVIEATGRSLAIWQAQPRQRLPLPGRIAGVALVPPPETVNPRIEQRLRAMLAAGALDEVRTLHQRLPDLARLPIAKLHGCRELLAVTEGRLDLPAAETLIAAQVRQYAKRQRTFLRHRLRELVPLPLLGDQPTTAAEALSLVAAVLA